jgi:hypothetical protein
MLNEILNSQLTRIIITPRLQLIIEHGTDQRRENLPMADEIALLLLDEENDRPRREIILTARPARDALNQIKPLHRIPYTHPLYHTFHYVLLYPFGEPGRNFLIRLLNPHGVRKRDRIIIQIYHRYLIYTRSNTFNIKYRGGRLFQQ